MPTITIEGYRFRFYSSDRLEPPHMHVIRDRREAKIWLHSLEIARVNGYTEAELTRIIRITRENLARLMEAWDGYFNL